jgi:putative phage-type endonuclease
MDQMDTLDEKRLFDDERRQAITSTDVPSILGLTKWGSPLSVYLTKVGEVEPKAVTLPMWMGTRLEGLVSELYTASVGLRVRADNRFHLHPKYPWFGCHLDRRVIGDPDLIVELKTRDRLTGWGDDGTDKVPPDVFCQVQAQLMITGAREAHVACLFSNRQFRVYRLLPDPEFAATLIPTLEDFWINHVVAHVAPPPGGNDVDTAIINGTAGGNSGHLRPATPEQETVVEKMRLARLAAAKADLEKAEAENRVKKLIGEDYDGITGSFGAVYWKRTKEIHKTEWELLAGVYGKAATELLAMLDRAELAYGDNYAALEHIALIRATLAGARGLYTTVSPGTRRIDVRLKGSEEEAE